MWNKSIGNTQKFQGLSYLFYTFSYLWAKGTQEKVPMGKLCRNDGGRRSQTWARSCSQGICHGVWCVALPLGTLKKSLMFHEKSSFWRPANRGHEAQSIHITREAVTTEDSNLFQHGSSLFTQGRRAVDITQLGDY